MWRDRGVAMVAALASAAALAAAGPRLEPIESGLPTSGQWRNGFDVADLDGDGHPDLLHGPPRKGRRGPVLFRGNGRGGFAPEELLRVPDLPFDYGDAAAADLDGDGRTDVAFAVHLGGLTALLAGAGGGYVESEGDLELLPPGEAGFSSRAIELADWNGDHRVDLVALGEGPALGSPDGRRGLAVFLNREAGWRRVEGPPERTFGDSLAIADFDGDGRLDALLGSRRLGDRGILRRQREVGGWEVATLEALRPNAYLPAVAVLDREGDRVESFVASWVQRSEEDWRSGIDRFHRTPEGWRRDEILGLRGAVEIGALAVGDVDLDGRADLVAGDATGTVRLFLGEPGDGLAPHRQPALARAGAGCAARHARLADLDGDRRPELLLAFASEPSGDRCSPGGSLQAWRVRP